MRRTEQRRSAIFLAYQRDVTGRPLEELVAAARDDRGRDPTEFARELAAGVERTQSQLDGLIADHAIGWSLDRIAPLERSILRIALFEILHRADVPREVAIDEAVEMAKRYCGSDAPAFVNGILGAVAREMGAEEAP